MAKTPTIPDAPAANPESDAFVREVDDAYRQDRLTGFWQRYGTMLILGTALFLIALAAFLYWQQQQGVEAGKQAESYDEAVRGLDLGSADARAEIDRFAGSGVKGYSTLGKVVQADLMVDDGDIAGAEAAYRAVADDLSVEQPVRDLARLKAVRLAFDDADPRAIITELKPVATEGSPWFGVAGEMLAAAHLKAGEPAEARAIFSAMAARDDLPASLRGRASQMAASLGGAAEPLQLDDEIGLDEPTAPEAAEEDAPQEETGE
ncbi:MAG: tetratricopeptide repeat protein [Pacificimonas sp.]